MKIKKLVLNTLAVLMILCIVGFFLLPELGTLSPKLDLKQRCFKLHAWHEAVVNYIVERNGKAPTNIYDVAINGDMVSPYFLFVSGTTDLEGGYDKLFDPNYYNQIVEYELATFQKGWYVIELKPGQRFKNRLLIDNNGVIYKLSNVKE